MPPARRQPDDIEVWVTVPVVVSEKRWRAVMRGKGIDMTGVVTAAHVGNFLRGAVVAMVDSLGVAPDRITKRATRTVHLPKGES
jgi:hypothetical protein